MDYLCLTTQDKAMTVWAAHISLSEPSIWDKMPNVVKKVAYKAAQLDKGMVHIIQAVVVAVVLGAIAWIGQTPGQISDLKANQGIMMEKLDNMTANMATNRAAIYELINRNSDSINDHEQRLRKLEDKVRK